MNNYRTSTLLFGLAIATLGLKAQTSPQLESILLNASVQSSPVSITLNWQSQASTTGYTIYRKLKNDGSWTSIGTASAGATTYQDNSVTVGTYYEYKVTRAYSGGTGYGYIAAGIQVPATDYRGKMVLLVDNTFITAAASQLTQLESDLRADGWTVLRSNVDRSASATSVRSIIQTYYNADPANVKAVYIIGHLAVPYSGNLNPDGHGDHLGAWPCDGYYGEMNGTWTDNTVNSTASQNSRDFNTPGDGKFDQSDFPSALELQVGRVDFYEFESFQYYAGLSETQLLINYLDKAHQFKTKAFTPTYRGAVFNNFDDMSYAFAGSGYRSISACVGRSNLSDLDPNGAAFTTYVNNQSYLWTYACGGGSWSLASNVGTTGDYASTVAMGGVFNMTFGSYFGDWNTFNNFLKAPLGSGKALTNVWAGIPNWWFHHMAMGDNIGYSACVSMNNTTLYAPQNPGWQGSPYSRVHMGLMGDPSLRQVMVPMPGSLTVTNSGGYAAFNWSAAAGVDGYFIYDLGATGSSPTRITPSMVTGTSFTSATVPFVAGRQYMVRAVKMETAATGSYQNLSLGVFGSASGAAAPDCLGVVGGTTVAGSSCNDNNACTINDVYNASCQCIGTAVSVNASITPAGATSFCTGGNVVLNASTGTNYTYAWKKDGTTISGATSSSYSASASGSYTVTVSNGSCSSTSSAVTVSVSAAPSATISAGGATTFCSGGSVTLNANTGTGYSYVWKNNGTVISGATASSYAATSVGSYTVTVSNNGCSATSAAAAVTVTAGPTATLTAGGATSFCTGGSVVLNASTGTNYTYTWKKDGTTINGVTGGNYTASNTGSYSVTVGNGTCSATSSSIAVTANATPAATITAGGATSFCSGGSVALNANTGTGYSYVWKNNGTAISGATSSSYSTGAAGNYTVTVSNGGCSASSSTTAVSVLAKPTVSVTANANNATLTASASGGTSPYGYTWNTSPVQSSATATVAASGTYTVTVTGANGCAASNSASITLAAAGACSNPHTETQAAWGGSWVLGSPAAYRDWHFASCFTWPNYLTIGCGTRTMRFTSAAQVDAFLPSTGALAQLPSGLTQDPGSSYSNMLAGELVALKLATKFDEANPDFSPSSVLLKDMLIASGVFAGKTVSQVMTIADQKLGSCGSSYTRSQIYSALVAINTGYVGGTASNGYLACPATTRDLEVTEEMDPEAGSLMGSECEELSVTLAPNPFQGATELRIEGLNADEVVSIEVWSSDGRLVLSKQVTATGDQQQRIRWDVNGLPPGMYTLRAVAGERLAVARPVLQ